MIGVWLPGDGEDRRDDHQSHDEMRDRARRQDDRALPSGLGLERAGAILLSDLVERTHSGDLDVAADRERRHAVFRFAPARGPELRSEADEESVDLYPE